MRLAQGEVVEGDLCWLGDESLFTFESLLLPGHVEALETPSFFGLLFFEGGQLPDVQFSLLELAAREVRFHLKVITLGLRVSIIGSWLSDQTQYAQRFFAQS